MSASFQVFLSPDLLSLIGEYTNLMNLDATCRDILNARKCVAQFSLLNSKMYVEDSGERARIRARMLDPRKQLTITISNWSLISLATSVYAVKKVKNMKADLSPTGYHKLARLGLLSRLSEVWLLINDRVDANMLRYAVNLRKLTIELSSMSVSAMILPNFQNLKSLKELVLIAVQVQVDDVKLWGSETVESLELIDPENLDIESLGPFPAVRFLHLSGLRNLRNLDCIPQRFPGVQTLQISTA